MGNTLETADTLKFIDSLQNKHFGQIDVFRADDGRFLMRVKRTHIVGDSRHIFFQRVVEWLQQHPSQQIVPIVHIRSEVERGLCIQFEVTQVYSEYYNFTLLDLLGKKELDEGQLWFTLEALLSLAATLRANRLAMNMKLDRVFLTLKGVPCVYFHHFLPLEESILDSHHSMAQQIAVLLLQLAIGQQIHPSQEEEESKSLLIVVGKVCGKFKLLGRLIKELLTREKTEEQALQEISALASLEKITKSTEIKLNKFRYAIPEQSEQKPKEPASQKRLNNSPVSFKPKKHHPQHPKSILQNQNTQDNQLPPPNDDFKVKQEELKRKLNEMAPKKQQTEKLFGQLLRRKEECRAKQERMVARKEQLLQFQKENRMVSRKDSSGKKGRERRLTEHSKCSNYR